MTSFRVTGRPADDRAHRQVDPGRPRARAGQPESAARLEPERDVLGHGERAGQAEMLVHAAHALCPYSRATRGNIDVQLKVNDQLLAKAA